MFFGFVTYRSEANRPVDPKKRPSSLVFQEFAVTNYDFHRAIAMRKAVLISTLSIFYIMGAMLFEAKVLGKVYVKYGYCFEQGLFKNVGQLISKVENKIAVDQQEIKELKKQLCKK